MAFSLVVATVGDETIIYAERTLGCRPELCNETGRAKPKLLRSRGTTSEKFPRHFSEVCLPNFSEVGRPLLRSSGPTSEKFEPNF